jgi:hypothetical protein
VKRVISVLVVGLALVVSFATPALADQAPGQLGYEGQPGNQGNNGNNGNGTLGYEGQPGNQSSN